MPCNETPNSIDNFRMMCYHITNRKFYNRLVKGETMKKYTFVPYELPTSLDGRFVIGQEDCKVLRFRREQLELTQQQVADRAGIKLQQYQRLETGERHLSGCSMRIGLAICAVLLLDPYEVISVCVDPPDSSTMKPQRKVDLRVVEVTK